MTQRPLSEIAAEIRADWGTKVHYTAKPYLDAMASLGGINDHYGDDDAKGVVLYFLSNASTWRGAVARKIKAELNGMVK